MTSRLNRAALIAALALAAGPAFAKINCGAPPGAAPANTIPPAPAPTAGVPQVCRQGAAVNLDECKANPAFVSWVASVNKWLLGAQPFVKQTLAWQAQADTYTACVQQKYTSLQHALTGD